MQKFKQLGAAEYHILKDLLKEFSDTKLAEFGVSLQMKGGTMNRDKTNLSLRMDLSLINVDGTVETREAVDFKAFASAYGFKPEDLHKEFYFLGKLYKITGLRRKAPRFPVLAQVVGGVKGTCFSADTVLRALDRPVTAAAIPAPRRLHCHED